MKIELYDTFRILEPIVHCGFLCWPFSVNIISYVSLLTKNQIFGPFLEVPKTRYSAETPYLEHSIA